MRKIDLSETIKVLDSEEFKKASYREKMRVYEMLDEVRKNNARCDYYSYVKYVHGDMYKDTRHGKFICDTINEAVNKRQDMLDGKIPQENQYIILSIPPRHGKSMNVTETLPSYFLGRFKDERVILTAYGDDLVTDFSRKNRDKVDQYGKELFGIELDPNTRSVTDWNIKGTRGGSIARGIMAGITGKGCQLLVIDDPVKNQEEANSEVQRDRIWGEWLASLRTRVEPPAIVIVIMTRWHEDDLVGRLLNPEYGEPLPWKVVNLPLEAEENDPLGRKIGEPLWPEKYGYDFIREIKQYPSLFNSLYQGRPTSMEGNILKRKWWKYYDILPQLQYKVLSIDASFKDGEKNDFVSIQVWGKTGVNMYMCDRYKARMDFPTTLVEIRNMLKKHKDITCILIEDKANGSALISVLRKEISGVIAVNPEGGKVSRVNAVAPHVEAGNVWLPRKTIAPWIDEFVDECASFPKGKHDDDVDAFSQSIAKLVFFYADIPHEVVLPGQFYSEEEKRDLGYTGRRIARPGKAVRRRIS
jgi:predicted phage terminase large subunit-like protein